MANTLVTTDMITRAALAVAHEKCSFLGTINRAYDDSFAKGGGKIGDTLRIRLPNQYTRTQGSRVMSVQQQNEASTTATVATQDHVDMSFNSAELALSIEELTERYIEPAVAVLVSGIESDVLQDVTKGVYQNVGTAGTVVGASGDISAIGNARAKLNQQLAPKGGNRFVQMDSVTMGSVSNGIKSLFHEKDQIEEAFREGYITRNQMATFYENERTWSMVNGSDVTGGTDAAAAVTDGGSTVAMATDIAVSAQKVGQIFTIAGVYDCHPETKQAYSHLKQFTITAIGAVNSTVSPTIYLGNSASTAAKQNVCSSTGAKLATTDFNSQVVTFYGSASTSYRANLMYHKDFATFITADLPIMADAAKCVRRQKDGLSLRVWQQSDIRSDELLMRIDILYGWKLLRPEWACRISN